MSANVSQQKMNPILVGYIQNNCLWLEPIATFKDSPLKKVIATGIPKELYSNSRPVNCKILVLENIDTLN